MRTWARLAVLGAAVLSVVAVPLIGLAVHWSLTKDGSLLVAVASVLVAVLGLGFSTVTYRWASTKQDSVRLPLEQLGNPASAHEATLRLLARLDDPLAARSYLGGLLVQELATIERHGQALLGDAGVVSVIRVREGLRRADLWSAQDIADFDRALRVRNEVAHGDIGALDVRELTDAYSTMKRLRMALDQRMPIAGQ